MHHTESMILSAPYGDIMLTAAATKKTTLKIFGQQRLNGTADWSAAEGSQVLPHFEHICSGGQHRHALLRL
jgi:hypothetical protein